MIDVVDDPVLQLTDVRSLGGGHAESVAELGLSAGAADERHQGACDPLGGRGPEIFLYESEGQIYPGGDPS